MQEQASSFVLRGVSILRKVMLLLATIAATVLLAAGMALTQLPEGGSPGHYIVVLDHGVSDPGRAANATARRHGLGVGFVYSHALKGFSAVIPSEHVGAVRADEQVEHVEPDETMYAVAQALPWGINKIDADISSTRAGNGSGSVANVNTYIIDSGIYRHTDLNVVKHVNFTGDSKNTDCNGHGTHVAGTVAAKDNATAVVGAAPGAPLSGVKVLGCDGSGYLSGIIEGVDWVTANAKKPAIANMSLSGPASQALDDAVRHSASSGVFYSIAAGNNGAKACTYSPSRAGAGTNNGIMTTAAINKSDQEPSWSNFGSCVELWAPGVGNLSTRKGGGTTTMGGTSQAAAHVGGGGALYLSSHASADPSSVESALKRAATTTANKSKDNKRSIVREYVGGF
jgi:subtilisin family serine protease